MDIEYIDKIKAFFGIFILSIVGFFLFYDAINSDKNDEPSNYIEIKGIVSDYDLYCGRNNISTMIRFSEKPLKVLIINEYRDALDFKLFRQYIKKGNSISIKIVNPEIMGFMDKFNYNKSIVHAKSVKYKDIELINKTVSREGLLIDYIFLFLSVVIFLGSVYNMIRLFFY